MKLPGSRAHLTYCTNVHPSESWPDVEACLRNEVVAVKNLVSPDAPMGVGLRISALAAEQLLAPGELERLESLLDEQGLYVFTLNGFPYGPFHGRAVKEKVYLPDWRSEERAAYTRNLQTILGRILPQDLSGSISTVPGGFRPELESDSAREEVAEAWLREAFELWKFEQESGKRLALAIEPEPHCMVETTEELVLFFQQHLLCERGLQRLRDHGRLSRAQAEEALHAHLGICWDACHGAVEFEDPDASLDLLKAAGIGVFKAQLSSGLRLDSSASEARRNLSSFQDEIYLHQTVVRDRPLREGEARDDQKLRRYLDLPEALQREEVLQREDTSDSEWRVHFHVPVFQRDFGQLSSTQDWLSQMLSLQKSQPFTEHLEVETYTWGVLPEEHRATDLPQAIATELRWVKDELKR